MTITLGQLRDLINDDLKELPDDTPLLVMEGRSYRNVVSVDPYGEDLIFEVL